MRIRLILLLFAFSCLYSSSTAVESSVDYDEFESDYYYNDGSGEYEYEYVAPVVDVEEVLEEEDMMQLSETTMSTTTTSTTTTTTTTTTTPAAPPVVACCPPGSRLRLKDLQSKGGGWDASCVSLKAGENVTREGGEPHLTITGNKLPQCSRGMERWLMSIYTSHSFTTTTTTPTTTTTTTEAPLVLQFRVTRYEATTPHGWRLASVKDVRDEYGSVKRGAKDAIRDWSWGIACLANDARVINYTILWIG